MLGNGKCCHLMIQVTVENFLRVLTGRLPPSTPRSKRLLSDDRSNILIYLTGQKSTLKYSHSYYSFCTECALIDTFILRLRQCQYLSVSKPLSQLNPHSDVWVEIECGRKGRATNDMSV